MRVIEDLECPNENLVIALGDHARVGKGANVLEQAVTFRCVYGRKDNERAHETAESGQGRTRTICATRHVVNLGEPTNDWNLGERSGILDILTLTDSRYEGCVGRNKVNVESSSTEGEAVEKRRSIAALKCVALTGLLDVPLRVQ